MIPKDNFSRQAGEYSRYRPDYPGALYESIWPYVKNTGRAWDCATGNGQAALVLAQHFQQVDATDISTRQLERAIPHPRIRYAQASASDSGFPNQVFDLITVAQAYHWFATEDFFRELRRVAKPDCILAVWCYGLLQSPEEEINRIIQRLYTGVLGPYWDKERQYIDQELKTIPFPFEELPAPDNLFIEKQWRPEELLGYFRTWSALQHYMEAGHPDPLSRVAAELFEFWPRDGLKIFRFPLYLKIGKIHKRH